MVGSLQQHRTVTIVAMCRRGIGAEGWDGSEHGVGRYENEASLREIFEPFGMFLSAAIRHRIQDGKNTSWAL